MKTYIIRLDPQDDNISICDKMAWAKAGRILLVWPDQGRLHTRRLDLVLLKRHSRKLGAQLALVSRAGDVREHALELGIPVFKDLRQAQHSNWRPSHRYRPGTNKLHRSAPFNLQAGFPVKPGMRPYQPVHSDRLRANEGKQSVVRLVFFCAGVIAVLALIAILIPGATVSLEPDLREQAINIEIRASQDIDQVSLSGFVPARAVKILVEGRNSIPVSGSIIIADQAATGQVVFTNMTDEPVVVPENTIIRNSGTPSLAFTVTQAGEVPAGPGQILSLPVRCLTLGSQGNLPGGKLIAIQGLLGTRVMVNNPQPTRGGSNLIEPAPTDNDRSMLYETLLKSLGENALVELHQGLEEGDVVFSTSLQLLQIIEESYLPGENQPADQLSLSLRVEYQALMVAGSDLRSMAEFVLDANLPAGFSPIKNSLQIENSTQPSLDGQQATWKIVARRQLIPQISTTQAAYLIVGLTPGKAIERLEKNLPLSAPPQIKLSPSWWSRLTIIPHRIQVTIKQ